MTGLSGRRCFGLYVARQRVDRLREFGVTAHPVAVAPDVHDAAAVEKPVQQRGGHDLVAIEGGPSPYLCFHSISLVS